MITKKIVKIFLIILLFTSCKFSTYIYYHDTNSFDDGEIWGSNLNLFFESNDYISVKKNNSKELYYKLTEIKKILLNKREVIDVDDGLYEIAFIINKKDTLYTNSAYREWRYQKLKSTVSLTYEDWFLERPASADL